jgi:hypothetical protein
LGSDHHFIIITIWQLSKLSFQGSVTLRNAESDTFLEDLIIKHDYNIILRILAISIHDLGFPRLDFSCNGIELVSTLITKHQLKHWVDLGILNSESLGLANLNPLVLLHHVDFRGREVNWTLSNGFLTHWASDWFTVKRDLHGIDTSFVNNKVVEISFS